MDAIVRTEQVRQLYRLTRISIATAVVAGAAMIGTFWHLAPHTDLVLWGTLLAAWALANAGRLRWFATSAERSLDLDFWRRLNLCFAAIGAGVFGSAMWLFFDQALGPASFLTLCVLLALMAGAIAVQSYHLPSLLLYQGIIGTNVALRLALEVGELSGGLPGAALTVFYTAIVMRFGRDHARLIESEMRLRHEHARVAVELAARTAEAEQASLAKSRFFAAASHDLRQPLHALGLYVDLLDDPERAIETAPRIKACVDALDALFDGILGIARLDAGVVEPRRCAFRLAGTLVHLRDVHQASAAAHGLELRWRVDPTLVVASDPVLVERILGNLLSNAVRHTQRGGALVAARARGDEIGIAVIDTGPGLDPTALASAFDEFVQFDNPARDASRGVGLGLPTVRRLVDLLEHRFIARSRPGRGSWFELRLPRGDPAAVAPPAEPDVQAGLPRGRALLLDDHAPSRDAIVATFARWGIACDAVPDLAAAEALRNANSYEFLLTDFRLPGAIDGFAIARRWRVEHPAAPLVCVISGEPDVPFSTLPPDIDWLRKPLKPARLRALLASRGSTSVA